MWSTNLHLKICRWDEKKKEPIILVQYCTSNKNLNTHDVNFGEIYTTLRITSDTNKNEKKVEKVKKN